MIFRMLIILVLFLVVSAPVSANGVGWGPPQQVLPYEIVVIVIESFAIFYFLKQKYLRALKISFLANLASWFAGIGLHIIGYIIFSLIFGFAWSAGQEPLLVMWSGGVEFVLLFLNILIESKMILNRISNQSTKQIFKIVILMNLVTWTGGMIIFSLMVKNG